MTASNTEVGNESLPFLNLKLSPVEVVSTYEKLWPVLQVPEELLKTEAEGPATQLPLLAQFKYVKFGETVTSSDFIRKLSYRRAVKGYERQKPVLAHSSYIETPLSTLQIPHSTELLIIGDLPTSNLMDRMNFSTDLGTDQCLIYLKSNLKKHVVDGGRRIFREALRDPSTRYPSQVMNFLHHLTLYVLSPTYEGEGEDAWKPLDSMDIDEFAGVVWGYLKNYRLLRVSFRLKDIRKVEKEIMGLTEAVEERWAVNDKDVRLNEAEFRAKKYLEGKEKDLEKREQTLALNQNELAKKFKELSCYLQDSSTRFTKISTLLEGLPNGSNGDDDDDDDDDKSTITLSKTTTQESNGDEDVRSMSRDQDVGKEAEKLEIKSQTVKGSSRSRPLDPRFF